MDEGTPNQTLGIAAADIGIEAHDISTPHSGQPPGSNHGADWVLRLIVVLFVLYAVVRMYSCAGAI